MPQHCPGKAQSGKTVSTHRTFHGSSSILHNPGVSQVCLVSNCSSVLRKWSARGKLYDSRIRPLCPSFSFILTTTWEWSSRGGLILWDPYRTVYLFWLKMLFLCCGFLGQCHRKLIYIYVITHYIYRSMHFRYIDHHSMQLHTRNTQNKVTIEKRQREAYLALPSYVQGLEWIRKGQRRGEGKSDREKRTLGFNTHWYCDDTWFFPGGKAWHQNTLTGVKASCDWAGGFFRRPAWQ